MFCATQNVSFVTSCNIQDDGVVEFSDLFMSMSCYTCSNSTLSLKPWAEIRFAVAAPQVRKDHLLLTLDKT
jgi:hypothetical protein